VSIYGPLALVRRADADADAVTIEFNLFNMILLYGTFLPSSAAPTR
jgi:hypothetical protein